MPLLPPLRRHPRRSRRRRRLAPKREKDLLRHNLTQRARQYGERTFPGSWKPMLSRAFSHTQRKPWSAWEERGVCDL